jgi:hypothetical protein
MINRPIYINRAYNSNDQMEDEVGILEISLVKSVAAGRNMECQHTANGGYRSGGS